MTEIDPVVRRYPPDCQPSCIEPLGSAGGMSGAQLWRIVAPRGMLALRRWPGEHPSRERLNLIHTVLRHAADRGIAIVPLPIAARDGSSFVVHAGHLWELTPWRPGAADYEQASSPEKLRAAVTSLAQFHVATADFQSAPAGAAPAVTRRLSRLHQLAHGEIQELTRTITDATWPDLAPLARQFIAVLPRALSRAVGQLEPLAYTLLPLQPCIRDIWHDHILFTGNEVTGLVDFGALDIDTPATDVARLLGSLAGDDANGWQSGLDAYSAIRPLSRDESLAVFALDTSGTLLAGCNWIRWIYIERRQFDNRAQVVDRFRRIAARTQTLA